MTRLGRILAFDVGTKRVGMARTDLLQTSANPAGTFPPDRIWDEIENYRKEHPVLAFVVGWPVSTTGDESRALTMVGPFIEKLKKNYPSIPVYKIDERYTSKEAVRTLIDAGVPRNKRAEKGRLDQVAAALILQQFLETKQDY